MARYDFQKIEKRWQKEWETQKLYEAKDFSKKPKYYALAEFPYLSGDGLHVGHVRSYTAMDIIARKRRMDGYNVFYPIGWDAFGLPTENYAIKTGIRPEKITKQNADNFRRQLKSIGFSFDWSREINTADPKYYKWTQWLFLQFFKHKLAYKANVPINWCPKDKIGLANEEVVGGKCERCGTVVEKRNKEQWMLRITRYAEKLLEGLKKVNFLPQIKLQQENWIGRSEGAMISFNVISHKSKVKSGMEVEVFTTRPDTLFGATYLVLAPENPLITALEPEIKNFKEVVSYIHKTRKKTEDERLENKTKTGVELKGVKAINPATKKEIPIWVADYVLASYGTGAIMAVPAHDERDFEFAKKYKLPIQEVIEPLFRNTSGEDAVREGMPFVQRNAVVCVVKHWKENKYLCLKWKKIDWRGFIVGGIEKGESLVQTAKREIREETGYTKAKFIRELGGIVHAQFFHVLKNENRWAHFQGLYFELQDGEQMPISEKEQVIHDILWLTPQEVGQFLNASDMHILWQRLQEKVGVYAGEGILMNSGKFSGMDSEKAKWEITKFVKGERAVTYKLHDWVFSRQRYWGEPIPIINCQKCGHVPVPEKDLPVKLPNIKNYKPRSDGKSPLASIASWVKVKCPKCKGPAERETDVMPNWAGSSWYYLRYTDPNNNKEFASKKKLEYWLGDADRAPRSPKGEGGVDWYNGGMEHATLHLLYSRFWNLFLHDIGLVPVAEPYKKRTAHGLILGEGGAKMSKSKGNVVNPDAIVKEFGADTLRLYEMFLGPFDQAIVWDNNGMQGAERFLNRLWRLAIQVSGVKRQENKNAKLDRLLHQTVKKVTEDIEEMRFNTAVSSMMILLNEFEREPSSLVLGRWSSFLKLLAPFAPHLTEELWHQLGHKKSIHLEFWPTYDPAMLKEDTFTLVIQVNGKVRDTMEASMDINENDAKELALRSAKVQQFLGDKEPRKVIYARGRLVNIVV